MPSHSVLCSLCVPLCALPIKMIFKKKAKEIWKELQMRWENFPMFSQIGFCCVLFALLYSAVRLTEMRFVFGGLVQFVFLF